MNNKWIYLLLLLLLPCCKKEKESTYFTAEKASSYIRDIQDICYKDNGKLWGKNLYGPIMFVDRTSRRITANMPDSQGILKLKEGIYSGIFPKELLLTDGPVTFGDTKFAMVALPPEEDNYRIKTRTLHALFHLYQESLGYKTEIFNIMSMDEKEGRLWLKLEWRALKKAINTDGEERQNAIRDALVFRCSNRELFKNSTYEAIRFETHEGLATFTHARLLADSSAQLKSKVLEYLDWFYQMPSYSRSYGLIHGALYATLLDDKGFDFTQIKSDTVDLGSLVMKTYDIKLPIICRDVAGSLAFSYGIDEITREEEKRFSEIQASLNKQLSTFTEKSVVFLELESPYFDFEPENIHPLDTLGTLYSSMRVSDNWGKLAVDNGGCLVSNNFKHLRLSAKGIKTEKNRISGEGWLLTLNDGWEIVEVNENYFLRKVMPLEGM
jgi:hypothetical protein